MERIKQRAWISWISVGLLALACAILAVLQFRWIGEVSKAERQRLGEEVAAMRATRFMGAGAIGVERGMFVFCVRNRKKPPSLSAGAIAS